jgi:ATPase subunit of ABC transporter with duplicated ATPase domains
MSTNELAIRFNEVSFEYSKNKVILEDASFSLREGSKITLMGQNGAGKTTLLELIIGNLKPKSGTIHLAKNLAIAYAWHRKYSNRSRK